MAEVLFCHHAQGLTDGIRAFADKLRQAGHTVHTPDTYDGKTFATVEEGIAYAREVGFEEIQRRGVRAAEGLPAELVYMGVSMGVMAAQLLAQTRAGARGAVLLEGCVPPERRIQYGGGSLDVRPVDWEAEGASARREARVAPFAIDATEMTVHRWQPCVASGACRSLAAKDPSTALEPGRPVTGVTPEEAMRACRFYGGRLPSGDEWVFASAGLEVRRFPWGQTGLVCRRAVFGLVAGPCARGAVGPEIAGTRPDGASPEGALDLVGNVAEWTLEADGSFAARGGSYASRVAADVKSWSVERPRGASPTIGFRCAYDVAE